MKRNRRVFVVGIDGATFRVISPMISNGKLLNIKMLIESGANGNLISTIPPLSPVAWTSITTGVNPARHGIVDFLSFDKSKRSFVFFDSKCRHVKPIWSVLSEYGYSACIINVPMTYPADMVNGFMVSGLGTPPGGEDLAYPKEVYDEMIKETGNYSIDIDLSADKPDFKKILQSMRNVMDSRIKAMNFLLKKVPYDLFIIVFTMTDRAQHFFWKFMDPSHPGHEKKTAQRYGNIIYEMYERVDLGIGEILKHITADDYIVIVSDHGFAPLIRGFSIGKWLWENDYLTVRTDLGLNRSLNIIRSVKRLVPLRMRYLVRKNLFRDKGHHKSILSYLDENIVWEKTKVFCHKLPEATSLYFNNSIVKEKADVESLKNELTLKLKEIRDSVTGSNVIKDVIDGHTLFNSSAAHIPDLVLIPSDQYDIYFNLFNINKEPLFQDNTYWSGKHDPEGIFVIYGPNIKRGIKIDNIPIVDVAPTVYFLFQIQMEKHLDGKVVKECFTKEFLESHTTTVSDTEMFVNVSEEGLSTEDISAISKRLRDLGYL